MSIVSINVSIDISVVVVIVPKRIGKDAHRTYRELKQEMVTFIL